MKRHRLLAIALFVFAAMMLAPINGLAQTTANPAGQTTAAKTTPAAKTPLLDLNTASTADLMVLPGIGKVYAQKIIDGRPYARTDQLVSKNIIPAATYTKIKDRIIADPPGGRGTSPSRFPGQSSNSAPPGSSPIVREMKIVDLNSASLADLETLPGITPDYARKIIAGRPYRSMADLERAGIPHPIVTEISPPAIITFEESAPPPKP